VKKSIARACENPDGKGERSVRAAKTLAGGGEQGSDRAVRRDSTAGVPPGEWGVPREEGCIDGAVLVVHGEGEQDQGGEGGDHEGAGGADGRH